MFKFLIKEKSFLCFGGLFTGFIGLVFLAFFTLGLAAPAEAAIVKKGQFKIEDFYNPNPAPNDLFLPMPCDLSMVFKAVAIPVTGKISDFETFLGADDKEQRPFINGRHLVHLSSDLALENLPEPMRKVLAVSLSQASTDQLYLFGKYEVTKAQWEAV
ncbi:MAG: hypothetical protein LBF38_02415, partial [Deltaproteobacteria bacterium]|nr:hypothetical protein [Deltaproteobacteria bacterium]